MNTNFNAEIQTELSTLGNAQQQLVLEFVRSLKRPIEGTPGQLVSQFAGNIPLDDLRQMEAAIESGCEQVDHHEW